MSSVAEAWAPRRRATVVLFVIALHLTLYLALRGSTGWQTRAAPRPAAARAAVTLRLLPWPQPRAAAASPDATPLARPTTRPPASRAITLPSRAPIDRADPGSVESTQTAVAPAPEPPASQPPRALELTLPRGFATRPDHRNPALADPRANTMREGPEQRLAAGLDTRVIEEALGDGRRRIRQGANCVIVTPARVGQLRPFDDGVSRTPSLVERCP